jgi:lipopolysaccharide export system protein LptC
MPPNMDKRTAHRWPLLLTIVAGCFLAFGSYWLLHLLETDPDIDPERFKNEPDYIIEKFSYVRMTPEGKPQYLFTGEKLTHRPVNDVSEVLRPVLQSLDPARPPSTITAQRALIHQSDSKVDLLGKVDIRRPETPAGEAVHIQTEELIVYPDEDRMESGVAVRGKVGESHIESVGMKANNATQQLHFASRARIVYPPKQ